jgi:hypothetical protein
MLKTSSFKKRRKRLDFQHTLDLPNRHEICHNLGVTGVKIGCGEHTLSAMMQKKNIEERNSK